nr:unnamed protein product [Spirometra erinaceieuropaei]
MVTLLLSAGADPNLTTRDAYTALHIAAKEGRLDIVQALLEAGADPDARTRRGFSPLHLAAKRGRAAVARQLLQVKSDNVNAEGRNGLTPLHMAVHYNHVQLVELLLDHGADASCAAGNGYTALHIAAKKNHQDIASLLLADDHDNHRSTNAESRSGFTPLHLASQEGNVDMVGLLLLNGAEPNHQAKNGLTPLHLAAQEDRVNVAQQLVSSGADISAVSHAGYTPLHTACHFGRLNMVRYLLSLADRVDVNRTTKMGFTPLHLAAQQGHSQIASLLLEHGADANLLNEQGLTAAHIARRRHFPVLFDTLRTVTTVVTQWEDIEEVEEVILDSPEFMGEGAAVDSDDEGIRSPVPRRANGHAGPDDSYRTPELYAQQIPDQQASASATDTVRVPVDNDQIWCEMEYLSQPLVSQTETAPDTSPDASLLQTTATNVQLSTPSPPLLSSAVDEPINETIRREEQSGVSMTLTTDGALSESDYLRDLDDAVPSTDLRERRVHRILTNTIPQYFALITRIRQDLILIGPEGSVLTSAVVPAVQVCFPPGALQKKIRVGLQVQDIPSALVTKCLGPRIAVSPIVSIEPRRRKFHRPITITIPLPGTSGAQQSEAGDNGQANLSTIRLLCSITESAGNLVPVAKSGEQLHFYLRAFEENRLNMLIRVKDAQLPHSGKLAFMPTQRTPGGTPVEPLTVLDVLLPRKLASTPRTGELERRAALEVSGYERTSDQIDGSLHPASSDEGYRCSASTSGMGKIVESIARSDLDVKRIAQSLGPDWPALAGELGLSRADCDSIAEENSTDIKRAYACLLLWQERSNKDAATGTVLGRALRRIGRDDILKQCMKNIELVQDENELSVAVRNLQHEDSELEMHEDSAVASPDAAKRPPPGSAETNDLSDTSPTDVETLISPVASSHGDMPPNRVGHATEEERRAAVEQLVAELDDDIPTPPSLDSGNEAGVEEAELVPHVKGAEPQKVEASQVVTTESGVPLSMLQEDEANEPSEVAVRIPLEATGNNPPVISNDDSITTEKSEEPVTFAEPMVVSCKSAELSSLPSDAASPTSCTRHRSPANTQECHLSLTRPTGAFPYNQPIGGLELDDVFPPSAPLPGEFNVSCSTSATTTYRADLKTQQDRTVDSRAAQAASYISTASSGGPLISGEFVLVRQGFDDGPAPLVREKADFVVPIPLTRGAAAPSVGAPHPQQLVGPGTCKITAQLRKQALLDGHFRLCRSRSARGAGPRVRDAQDTEEDELPPEPPRRTTSLVAGRCSRDDMQVNYGGPNQPSGSPPLPFDAAPVTDLGVIPLWDGSHPREVDDLIKNLGWLATDRNIRE